MMMGLIVKRGATFVNETQGVNRPLQRLFMVFLPCAHGDNHSVLLCHMYTLFLTKMRQLSVDRAKS